MTASSIKTINPTQVGRRSWPSALARRLLLSRLPDLRYGTLILEDGAEVLHFGEPISSSAVIARIHVHSPAFYSDVVQGGSIGAAESYIEGHWTTEDLLSVVRLICLNLVVMRGFDRGTSMLRKSAMRAFAWLRRNSLRGSRRNIRAHYDLGNDFFRLFLDPEMMYSCARFSAPDSGLDEASVEKLDWTCRKLDLRPEHHLLEIGTGWGGMALYAAQHYGCRVTTTTISREQFQYAQQRVREAGLEDRVTVLCEDYRELDGQYDRLVSIEMIEAVGHKYLGGYFEKCSSLLKADGKMVIQAILIPEQRFSMQIGNVDFIQRYIFPGGFLPSIGAISDNVGRYTDLKVVEVDDMTEDYARTLACWRERFDASRDEVRAQGFDDQFLRLWEYYLCYCEGGFRERVISTAQFEFEKPLYRPPVVTRRDS